VPQPFEVSNGRRAPQLRHRRPKLKGGYVPHESGSSQGEISLFAGKTGEPQAPSVSFESR
jgi:hypothetical protein